MLRIFCTGVVKIPIGLMIFKRTADGRWLVTSNRQGEIAHHVVVHIEGDLESFASCTCGDFFSSLLPCSAVCYAYSKLDKEIFQVGALHPRWRLDRHPLIDQALQALGLKEANEIISEAGNNFAVTSFTGTLDLDLYQQIKYPSKQATRYQKIDEVCKQISALGSNKGEHIYRLTMMKCNRALNEIKNAMEKGMASETISSIQPPQLKKRGRGRMPKRSANQSRLCKITKNKEKPDAPSHNKSSTDDLKADRLATK